MFEAAPHPAFLKLAIAAVAGFAALGFLAFDFLIRRRAARARAWPVVPGIITSSRTVRRWGMGNGLWIAGLWYVPEIAYRYEVAGSRHTASRVFLTDASFSKLSRAREIVARYPVGAAVDVHHDPANPASASLEPAVVTRPALGPAFLLAAVACGALLVG